MEKKTKKTERKRKVEWIKEAVCYKNSLKRCRAFSLTGDGGVCHAVNGGEVPRQIHDGSYKNTCPDWCPKLTGGSKNG